MNAYEAGYKMGRSLVPPTNDAESSAAWDAMQKERDRFGSGATEFMRGYIDGLKKTHWLNEQAAAAE